jgi:hypothetical protein
MLHFCCSSTAQFAAQSENNLIMPFKSKFYVQKNQELKKIRIFFWIFNTKI